MRPCSPSSPWHMCFRIMVTLYLWLSQQVQRTATGDGTLVMPSTSTQPRREDIPGESITTLMGMVTVVWARSEPALGAPRRGELILRVLWEGLLRDKAARVFSWQVWGAESALILPNGSRLDLPVGAKIIYIHTCSQSSLVSDFMLVNLPTC